MSDAQLTDDLDALAETVKRKFPDMTPVRPLCVLGSGFRSVALVTASGVVLRIGRSPDAATDYAKEWRIGPFLARSLGDMVPNPRWYAEPCAEFPHGALGYLKLPGDTPRWGVDPGVLFAQDLGVFMAKLHSLSVEAAAAAGVPEVDSYRRVLNARSVVMPVLSGRLESHQFVRVEAWWESFATDSPMDNARIAVCHHDLWHDNLLRSDSGGLSGVLDMAHIEITDPAHDFSAPRYFGEPFMDELMPSYRSAGSQFDASDEYRAQRFHEAREFGGLAWAIEHDDQAEVDDAVEKIKRGPILGRT